MSGNDWTAGDRAVCISDQPLCPDCWNTGEELIRCGMAATVAAVIDYQQPHPALVFLGVPPGHYCACSFRKIRPDEPKEADELERCPLLLKLIGRRAVA